MAVTTFDIDRDRRDIDVSRQIARLVPDENPFTVILMRARKKATRSAEIVWYDNQPDAWWTQVNNAAGYTDTDTTIAVTDASIFRAKDLVKVARTGEIMFVNATDTVGNTITVVRGYGTTPAVALNNQDWLMMLPNSMEANSTSPQTRTNQPVKHRNYVQTVRTPFDASMESDLEALRTDESERDRLRRDYLLVHRLAIERALIWGEPKEDTANKRRMAGGLSYYITSNVYDAGGALTESKFEDFCEMLFKYGRKTKLLVTSPHVGSIINQFAAGKIMTRSGEDTYGIQLSQYQSFHGRLYIVTSNTFEHDYATLGFGLDMTNIAYRPQEDTKLRTNIQENDRDGWKDEYLTRFSLEVNLEKTHAILKNAA